MSFEVTTVTSMDSQEPACCDDGHLLASQRSRCEHAAYLISPVFGGTKFDRGWDIRVQYWLNILYYTSNIRIFA